MTNDQQWQKLLQSPILVVVDQRIQVVSTPLNIISITFINQVMN